MKNKKAVSGIVVTVIMIALVVAIGGVVWGVVNNLVTEQLEDTGSCFNIFEKVSINNKYTCWNSSTNEFLFSVNVGDIDLSKLVVTVSGEGKTKSYELTSESTEIEGISLFPNKEPSVAMPGKNEGLTYIVNADVFESKPDSVVVYPVVGTKQCDAADTLTSIDSCFFFE